MHSDTLILRARRKLRQWRVNRDPRRFHVDVLARDRSRQPASLGEVVLFNHYDASGEVAAYVLCHLEALLALGFSIVVVTTAPQLHAAALQSLRERCWLVLHRANRGLDLGGWPPAVRQIEIELAQPLDQVLNRLVIANDSVFGPIFPLGPIFSAMTLQSHDIWGITESRERALHLQSYFVVFERSALKFLRDWLSTFQYLEDKDALIMRFEIGMSESARARGLRLGAWVPSSTIDTLIQRQLNAMNGTDVPTGLNPTHTHWREIVLHAGSPFIKRDLVRAAEGSAEGQRAWRLLLAEVGATGLTALIEDYLTDGSRISSQPHCFSMNDGLNP